MTLVLLYFPVPERLQHFTRLPIGDCDRVQVRMLLLGSFFPMAEDNTLVKEKKPIRRASSGTLNRNILVVVMTMPGCWGLNTENCSSLLTDGST